MNNCKLCRNENDYDFRQVQITKFLGKIKICFSGNLSDTNRENGFKYCPECGRKLIDEDFNKALW